MTGQRVTVRAPAKVNLSLAVLGKRPDGYHEIDTVLMTIGLHDRLTLEERGDELTLALGGPASAGVPGDGTNLALRALRRVVDVARRRGVACPGLHLELEKHIPAAAGLGGGSSDAAAALLACSHLLGVAPDDPELVGELADLGSDCPFFVAARASGVARCTGRGERVEPLAPLPLPWAMALVTPRTGCSTAEVYRAWSPSGDRGGVAHLEAGSLARLPLEELQELLFNDLEPAALRGNPELRELRELLEEHAPGAFRLAGSGSSWFGFFRDELAARTVLDEVRTAAEGRRYGLRGCWVLAPGTSGLQLPDSKSH